MKLEVFEPDGQWVPLDLNRLMTEEQTVEDVEIISRTVLDQERATPCHLLHRTDLSDADLQFVDGRRVIDDDKFSLAIVKCATCEQLYVHCFSEISFPGVDAYWNHFIPVSVEEANEVTEHPRKFLDLIEHRNHILRMPRGAGVFWSKGLSPGQRILPPGLTSS